MTTEKYLQQISDDQGPLQILAAELMEQMTPADFAELIHEITITKLSFHMEGKQRRYHDIKYWGKLSDILFAQRELMEAVTKLNDYLNNKTAQAT